MNVRVNLNYPIYDGAEIVFKAPCDASEVTGLIVYYPGDAGVVSSEFAFADAHASDLGNIDALFKAGAVVKVIIDTDTNKAFVQNAVTNAYLEERFAGIGGGGGSTVIVTLVGLGKASHTSLQIAELLKNGHNVLFCNGTYYSLDVARDSVARFSAVSDDGSVDLYEINNAGEVEYFFLELTGGGSVDLSNYYTKEEVDQKVETGGNGGGNLYTFRNLLNPNDENYEAGKYAHPTTGKTANNANYNTSGYIEVAPGDRICTTTSYTNAFNKTYRQITPITWIAYYNENKTVVKGDGKWSGEKVYHLIPQNVRYVRVSIATADMDKDVMIENLACVGISDEYLEYGQEKTVVGPAVDNKDGMFLPPYIYATGGRPFDIYTAAMFGDTQNLNRIERIGVSSSSAGGFGEVKMSNRRIRMNPSGDACDNFYFKVKNAEGVTVLSDATRCVVNTGSTATKSIVAIGDSLTENKPWIAELMRLNPNYNFVGSQAGSTEDSTGITRTFKHEGRGGWRAEQYCTDYSPAGNAFWDATNNKFSFSYYVENTLGGTPPDIVILFLGMNDMERNLDDAVNYEKLMVDNIRSSYSTMPIVICAPQARDYNGEGHVAKNGFLMMKKLYEAFALYQNLYFVPLYLIHDSEYNYCLADEYEGVNLYSTITKNKVTDTVHPQAAGYFQFADAIYGALSAIG